MRLFLKEHFSLVLLNLVQLFFFFLVYWLAGQEPLFLSLYAMGLGVTVLISYLGIRYIKNRSLFHYLEKSHENLEDTVNIQADSTLGKAVAELLQHQYRYYQTELEQLAGQQQDYYRFVNQWVHHMKTPLSVIEMIVQDNDDAESRDIQDELQRISHGLEMALYVARLEDFQQDFKAEYVNIAEMARQVVGENKRYFIRSNVYPKVNIPENLYAISDAKWLPFILKQLVTNAIKYSANSGSKVIINGCIHDDQRVVIEVQDEGIGILTEDISRVFQPFYTGQNGRLLPESTGMGLYLVKEICERLGHQVALSSEAGKGTTVTLLLQGKMKE